MKKEKKFLLYASIFLLIVLILKRKQEKMIEIKNKFYPFVLNALQGLTLTDTEKNDFIKRILAIIQTESSGNENVNDGTSGEIGLMQIIPKYGKTVLLMYFPNEIFEAEKLREAEYNIKIGSLLLYDNWKKSKKNIGLATQRYNSASAWKSNNGSANGLIYLAKVVTNETTLLIV